MGLIMEERVKHRVVGLAVIISIGIILGPAIIRKSNQRIDVKTKTTFNLPKRPIHPNVSVKEKEEIFQSVKVAHVSLDIPQSHPIKTIAKAKPISNVSRSLVKKNKPIKLKSIVTQTNTTKPLRRYTVQLASFSQRENAISLVSELQKKGFKARFDKSKSKSGSSIYKVVVGNLSGREKANRLKKKLVQSTRLNGIVIKNKLS
jgi:DedD protein